LVHSLRSSALRGTFAPFPHCLVPGDLLCAAAQQRSSAAAQQRSSAAAQHYDYYRGNSTRRSAGSVALPCKALLQSRAVPRSTRAASASAA